MNPRVRDLAWGFAAICIRVPRTRVHPEKRKKLEECSKQYDAVIVLGCESATQTVRDVVKSDGCKVIEGMNVAGIMNAQLSFDLPGNISFENCKIVPMSHQKEEKDMSG